MNRTSVLSTGGRCGCGGPTCFPPFCQQSGKNYPRMCSMCPAHTLPSPLLLQNPVYLVSVEKHIRPYVPARGAWSLTEIETSFHLYTLCRMCETLRWRVLARRGGQEPCLAHVSYGRHCTPSEASNTAPGQSLQITAVGNVTQQGDLALAGEREKPQRWAKAVMDLQGR